MKKHIAAFASVTYANKAKTALNRAGIPAEIRRTPGNISGGCGYSVLTAAPAETVIRILGENRIPYKSINEYGGRNEHM